MDEVSAVPGLIWSIPSCLCPLFLSPCWLCDCFMATTVGRGRVGIEGPAQNHSGGFMSKFRRFHCLQQPSAIQVHVETYINTWRSCRGQIYPIFLCTPALRGRWQPAWSLPPSGPGSDGKDESSMVRCPCLPI